MLKKLVGTFNRVVKKKFPSRRHRTVDQVIEKNPLSANLEQNIQRLREIFDSCSDVVFREFKIGTERPIKALLLYIDGLSEKSMLTDNVLKSLMLDINGTHAEAELNPGNLFRIIENQIVTLLEVKQTGELTELVNYVLGGDVVLLFDGESRALVAGASGWESRSVAEPETETVVRGPRDGDLGEHMETHKVTDKLPVLEKLYADQIKEQVQMVVTKAQSEEYRADIFGFGEVIRKKYPKEWRKLEQNWSTEHFPRVKVILEVEAKIRQTGMISESVPVR